ncbi:alpha/beta hydrolase fold protein [Kribbella flavida DSM 17836]|uniref:Alpha/beta hydrolase fold protein n=1 Tax=Kribbella flavida (strain DSM 17836 / JCM 10339 / NBRC 14399) TaxID=479435 RepID=D2PWA9_KRIFD|nr:alpha/beta hydrolase [Kribbella flavida]ADB31561.1 alpha/beta hydrolase fold protein [Kribbella flavida DSM 17836]
MTEKKNTTVVLVHGAFADAASWTGVIDQLQQAGVTVTAVANPLRGLTPDAAYVAAVVRQIDGPVLLVGHSYGGAVINAAARGLGNVVGLVHVAAFVPDTGESLASISAGFPNTPFGAAVRPTMFPQPDGTEAPEVHLDPAAYPDVFAGDLPIEVSRVLAVAQRPIAVQGLEEKFSGEPAWKALPTWTLVATEDNAIHPDAQRFMAERAGGTTIEVAGSHSVAVSQPKAVADLVLKALS